MNKFPKLDKSSFEFYENKASGYSTQSFKTKMGGANNVLQIRVTNNQLWLKTNFFMAIIADKFDLLHIIPINKIHKVSIIENQLNLEFVKNSENKKIVLRSKKQKELLDLLNKKMNTKNGNEV